MNYRLVGKMRKALFVWEMGRHKARIKPETKARMQTEFEDSVIALAEAIETERSDAL